MADHNGEVNKMVGLTREGVRDALNILNEIARERGYAAGMVAVDAALSALSGPVPDPETGLCKCGCGGKAEYEIQRSTRWQVEVSVGCPECLASGAHAISQYGQPIEGLKMIARENWNRAMGYRR